jgi:hypothetical protein
VFTIATGLTVSLPPRAIDVRVCRYRFNSVDGWDGPSTGEQVFAAPAAVL